MNIAAGSPARATLPLVRQGYESPGTKEKGGGRKEGEGGARAADAEDENSLLGRRRAKA